MASKDQSANISEAPLAVGDAATPQPIVQPVSENGEPNRVDPGFGNDGKPPLASVIGPGDLDPGPPKAEDGEEIDEIPGGPEPVPPAQQPHTLEAHTIIAPGGFTDEFAGQWGQYTQDPETGKRVRVSG